MSEVRTDIIKSKDGNGPVELHKQSAAKAWLNWTDTSTATILNSLNIASITDNSNGNYTPFFTSDFADHHYAAVASGMQNATNLAFEVDSTASNRFNIWLSVGGSQTNNVIIDGSSIVTGDLG